MSQEQAAAELGILSAAEKVAIQRLRIRFRVLIRAEIEATAADSKEVDDELRHLVRIVSVI